MSLNNVEKKCNLSFFWQKVPLSALGVYVDNRVILVHGHDDKFTIKKATLVTEPHLLWCYQYTIKRECFNWLSTVNASKCEYKCKNRRCVCWWINSNTEGPMFDCTKLKQGWLRMFHSQYGVSSPKTLFVHVLVFFQSITVNYASLSSVNMVCLLI